MNDPLLIQQLQQGNQQAFKQLVETYQNMVYNTALGIVQQAEEAEDVAQEVFVQVHQSVDRFRGEAKISTWIYRITITKSLDWQRKKQRKKRFGLVQQLFGLEDDSPPTTANFSHPGLTLDNKENGKWLFKAINQLADNQKIAFVLHYTEGLSYKDIAEIMEVSVASVEAYLHRAKQNLRKELEHIYHPT